MVNGAQARPLAEFSASRPGKNITPFQFGDVKTTSAPVSAPRASTVDAPGGNQPDRVMIQYQRLMQRFLETQKAVMIEYLDAGGPARLPVEASEAIKSAAADSRTSQEAPAVREPLRQAVTCRPCNAKPANRGQVEAAADVAAPFESTVQPMAGREELAQTLLKIVGDRTGYPPDMLGLNLDLEADLGIDSIKRTEIIGHFLQTIFPPEDGGPPEELIDISGINTLGGIIERVLACRIPAAPSPAAIPVPPEPSVSPASPTPSQAEDILPRFTLAASPAPAPTRALRLAPGRVVMITDDGRGVAAALGETLRQRGLKTALIYLAGGAPGAMAGYQLPDISSASLAHLVETIRREQGPIGALVHLLPLRSGMRYDELDLEGWRTRLQQDIVTLYQLLQLTGADLNQAAAAGGAWVMSASGLGGLFATDPLQHADFFPGQGAISGLLKTVALEFPEVSVKCVDLHLAEAPAALADHLFLEIEAQDGLVEVGYHQGHRIMLTLRETPLPSRRPNDLNLDASSIILVTGGARGITAAVSREIARKYRPTLIVAGRAPLPAKSEAAETAGLTQPQELKAALVERWRRQGQPINLTEVETAYRNLLKEREIRANLAALRLAGARVAYFQVDVRDPVVFGELLDQIYRDHGRLDGVVHGAGIIEDKLLQDKSRDSFDRVFGTKTESAFILSQKLRPETLKFLVFFSSVAGRFGSRGQADYTAANEVYNKLAIYLDQQWPGRVLAINWGPWKTAGMVSAEVQRQFEAWGVGLIEPAAGARTFDLELHRGHKGEAEVVIGDGPWRQPALANLPEVDVSRSLPLLQHLTTCQKTDGHVEILRRLDPDHDLYLKDHRLDFKPVLPAAVAIEFMAEAAQWNYPEWRVAGLKGVRVYKGIVLDNPYRDIRIIVDLPCVALPGAGNHGTSGGDQRRRPY